MVPTLLILLGTTVTLQADLSPNAKSVSVLPPINFTIKVTRIAQVLLHWEPNPDQGQRNADLSYLVKIHAPHDDDYETRRTESKCVAPLHEGFSASVQTILRSNGSLLASSWVSAKLKAPPGFPGTSAVNLTCTTNTIPHDDKHATPYQVSLRCTWLAGADAPEDTQYFLFYRYSFWTEECREYRRDALKRNTSCWFPRTFIPSKGLEPLVVHVNGSSRRAVIKPFDQLFALHAIDQVNPPTNVTAVLEGSFLSIRWKKPLSVFPRHCFEYEVKICNTKNGYLQMEKLTTNEFISKTDNTSKYSVQVRAAVSSACRAPGLWSQWSEPVYVGSDDQKPLTEWFLILLFATICFTLLVFSLFCRICHFWTRLFPPVPAPKSNIKELFVMPTYEKAGSIETETEVVSYVEELGFETLENSVF